MDNAFCDMPEISENARLYMKTNFEKYLFFENFKNGERRYTCSHCGKVFYEGPLGYKRTETPADRELYSKRHNDEGVCPYCKAKSIIKNIKLQKLSNFDEEGCVCFYMIKSFNEVWIRCFDYQKEYCLDNLRGCTLFREWFRYKLTPGRAECWRKIGDDAWGKKDKPCEAFLWNHGLYVEKYPYEFVADGESLDKSFLKYHSFEIYENRDYKLPFIKYLCWYSIHPQIEMLAKLGHFETIDEMVYRNTDSKRTINWRAKTPWELYGLDRNLYKLWSNKYSCNLKLLKVFKALKGKTEKDMQSAKRLLEFSYNKLEKAKINARLVMGLNTDMKSVIKYCERVAMNSRGACHHCPGITTTEAFEMWLDYLSLAKTAQVYGKVSFFPSDLKAAHDSFLTASQLAKNKKEAKEAEKRIKGQCEDIRRRFPKMEKIYESIFNKYSYTSGKYSVIVPKSIDEIIINNAALHQCMDRNDRYFERVCIKESFILFLRYADKPDFPWYTLEVEPSGTLRQKRTVGDEQLADLKEAMPFLLEWQAEVSKRLNKADKRLADKSKILRNEHFAELEQSGKRINYGGLSGQRLIDVLRRDLLEA